MMRCKELNECYAEEMKRLTLKCVLIKFHYTRDKILNLLLKLFKKSLLSTTHKNQVLKMLADRKIKVLEF